MNEHQNMLDDSRETKKTLYVVTAFYVAVGFALLVSSAVTGELLGTFLGFVIISGALAVTALLRAVLRIGLRVSAIEERMEQLHRGFEDALRPEASVAAGLGARAEALLTVDSGVAGPPGVAHPDEYLNDEGPAESASSVTDPTNPADNVPARGNGSPSVIDLAAHARRASVDLAAATLDRGVFPRLMASSEPSSVSPGDDLAPARRSPTIDAAVKPPDDECGRSHQQERNVLLADFDASTLTSDDDGVSSHGEAPQADRGCSVPSAPFDAAVQSEAGAAPVVSFATAVAASNLQREWKVALREGDVSAARRVYSLLADISDGEHARRMTSELDDLENLAERSLREEFAERASRRDFVGMVETGERILDWLPDREIARDAERLLPMLTRKAAAETVSTP